MQWLSRQEGGCCPLGVDALSFAVSGLIYSLNMSHNVSLSRTADADAASIAVHTFNPVSKEWKAISKPAGQKRWPERWIAYTGVALGERIFVFGGKGLEGSTRLYCFNTRTCRWSSPRTRGATPPCKYGGASCAVGSSLYFCGGMRHIEEEDFKVHRLDTVSMAWSLLHCKGKAPTWRFWPSVAAIGSRMYLFAGQEFIGGGPPFSEACKPFRNQVHYLDTVTLTWHEVSQRQQRPQPPNAGAAINVYGKLLIFGGSVNAADAAALHSFNDLWLLDPCSGSWKELRPSSSGAAAGPPSPRRHPAMCQLGPSVFIMGGKDKDDDTLIELGDLVELRMLPSLKELCQSVILNDCLDEAAGKRFLPAMLHREMTKFPSSSRSAFAASQTCKAIQLGPG